MLATNYRCPPSVVTASARMVAVNRERFAKPIHAPAGISDDGHAVTAWNTADPRWAQGVARLAAVEGAAGRGLCFLSRTRGELTPVLLALVHAGIRHTTAIPPIVESERVIAVIDDARGVETPEHPFHVLRGLRIGRGWSRDNPASDHLGDEDHAALDALLGWTAGFARLDAFVAGYDAARARVAALRDPS